MELQLRLQLEEEERIAAEIKRAGKLLLYLILLLLVCYYYVVTTTSNPISAEIKRAGKLFLMLLLCYLLPYPALCFTHVVAVITSNPALPYPTCPVLPSYPARPFPHSFHGSMLLWFNISMVPLEMEEEAAQAARVQREREEADALLHIEEEKQRLAAEEAAKIEDTKRFLVEEAARVALLREEGGWLRLSRTHISYPLHDQYSTSLYPINTPYQHTL